MKNINFNFRKVWVCILLVLVFTGCKEEETIVGAKPIADAGADIETTTGATVTLDGSGSSDADGDPLTYAWEIVSPAGASAAIVDISAEVTSFTAEVAGVYTVRLSVDDGNNAAVTDDVIITVTEPAAVTVEISSDISTDTEWEDIFEDDTPDYLITRSISVDEGATLTIAPGVIVAVNSDIYIDVSGAIVANGTATNPIVFTGSSETKGFWRGLFIFSNNTNNLFNNVTVEYAGGDARGFGISSAAVGIDNGGRFKIKNSTIQESNGYGLFIESAATLDEFSQNTFTNNAGAPLGLDVNNISKLDETSKFTLNGNQFIEVFGSTLNQSTEVNWKPAASNVPYRATGNISVESGLLISSGFDMEFASGIYLQIDNGSTTTGYLKALGSNTQKITFRGANDVAGFWMGIQVFTNDTNNQLDHVVIKNGGSTARGFGLLQANLAIDNGDQITISNSEFSMASGYGLYCENGSKLVSLTNSVFKNNTGLAAAVDINSAHVIDGASLFNEGNGDNSVEITGQVLELNTIEVSWAALSNNTPYFLSKSVSIESGLILNDGVNIKVGTDKYIQTDDDGYITANGSNGISITGKTANPGSWMGIQFFTNDTRNVLNGVTISHGGSSARGFGLPKSNVAVDNGDRLTITNCTITDCDGTGLFGESGSTVTQSGNTFTNNVVDLDLN